MVDFVHFASFNPISVFCVIELSPTIIWFMESLVGFIISDIYAIDVYGFV